MRRDLADVFGTLAEGVKGKRAVEWRLVDARHPGEPVQGGRGRTRARRWRRRPIGPAAGPGVDARPARRRRTSAIGHRVLVGVADDRSRRSASRRSSSARPRRRRARQPRRRSSPPATSSGRCASFRELDDAILRLRLNEPEIGTVVLKTEGDPARVLAGRRRCSSSTQTHWFVREVMHFIKRTLKRVDLSARSFFAFIEPGNAFAGTLFELALAADRSYMLDDPERPNTIQLSRHERRAVADEQRPHAAAGAVLRRSRSAPAVALAHEGPFDADAALEAGLVTFAPDEIDWDDEVRLAIESARGALARRAHGHGSEPALRRARDAGDEDLRPALGVAELDLPAPERRRPEGRAHRVRQSTAEFDSPDVVDPAARVDRTAPLTLIFQPTRSPTTSISTSTSACSARSSTGSRRTSSGGRTWARRGSRSTTRCTCARR